MADLIKINGHGHLLPYPEEIPRFMQEKEIFWIDPERQFMRQKDWQRPITDASFFLDEKLAWMAKHSIEHEVVLTLSQLYCNGVERKLANDVLRFQNDYNAMIQAKHPGKFTTGFVIHPACIDSSLKEIERCVEELDLHLMCLPTHWMDDDGQWHSVADEQLEPIFKLANEYKLAMEIHPYDGPRMIGLKDRNWRFHLVWMCAQTADTYHLFTLLDYDEIYPNIRTCFAHGNQFAQMNVGRRVQGFEGRPDLFEGARHPLAALGAHNLFFDTLVHDKYSLELLIRRQGVSQILAGLDDPYPLGEMETVPGSYPGRVLDEAMAEGIITEEDRADIWCQNVLNWLGEPTSTRIKKHLKLETHE